MRTSISITELREEAEEVLQRVWFVQSIDEIERTDITLSLRLHIRPGLFVHAFAGERTGSLYFALIEGNRRIFGIDCEGGEWHQHSFEAPDTHEPLAEGLTPKPLLTFLAQVESLLIEHDLL